MIDQGRITALIYLFVSSLAQNYEKVVQQNQELQKELEVLKRELTGLKNTCQAHSICCPSTFTVKCESDDLVKTEPMTDDELLDSEQDCQDLHNSHLLMDEGRSAGESLAVQNIVMSLDVPSWELSQSPMMIQSTALGNIGLPHREQTSDVHQSQRELLQQLMPQVSTKGNQQHQQQQHYVWQSSSSGCLVQNQCSTRRLSGSTSISQLLESVAHGREDGKCFSQRHQHQTGYVQSDRPEEYYQSTPSSSCAAATLQAARASASNSSYTDLNAQPLLTHSPCQVVPSVQSPVPVCASPRTSCSTDLTRHRSLSGGSVSASETAMSCLGERRVSSVSSDGSFYPDNRGNVYHDPCPADLPDADTDDVFVLPASDGGSSLGDLDVNNNNILGALPGHITEGEGLRFPGEDSRLTANSYDWWNAATDLMDSSRGDITNSRDSNNNNITGDSDDVSVLLQISNDQLLFYDPDNVDLTEDVFPNFVSNPEV